MVAPRSSGQMANRSAPRWTRLRGTLLVLALWAATRSGALRRGWSGPLSWASLGRRALVCDLAIATSSLATCTAGVPGVAEACVPYSDTYKLLVGDERYLDANLSTRVVRGPQDPVTCRGAEIGDFLTIRYAAAYEVPGASQEARAKEASVDLLSADFYDSGRWTVYDSSDFRDHEFYFPIGNGNMIAGVEIGLLGMCEGEQRVLYIPASMAYGAKGNKVFDVPRNALIRFDVSLEQNQAGNIKRGGVMTRRIAGLLIQ
mmetsp:Transcript_83979/g.271405  ORF Transcript_83979/g.271405 Transcript_83979/m.271405 type:complete len:259 (-) Transcript_83979:101-877(-)